MRRPDDGWDDGRRDWENNGGRQNGRAGGAHGDDRNGGTYNSDYNGSGYNGSRYNGDGYNGQAQGHGRPEYPGYPGAGSQEPAAASWDWSAWEATSAGYDGQAHGGQAAGEVTRVDRAFRDSGYGTGYSADGYQQQTNFQPASGTPAELSPDE